MENLATLVKHHDHFFHYSDCGESYRKGKAQREEILLVSQTATDADKAEAREIWTASCGSDLPCPF